MAFFATDNKMRWTDSAKASFGDGDDLQLFHNGAHSVIDGGGTGSLFFLASTYRFRNAIDTEDIAKFTENGSVELYYDNSKKFETLSTGVKATGNITLTSELNFSSANNKYIDFDTDNDGGTTYTAHFRLVNNAQNSFHNAIKMSRGGTVELYYNNSKKFETTSDGVKITGGLQDGDGDLGSSGQVLSSTGTALNWVDADSGPQGVQGLKGNNGSSGSNGAQGIAGSDGTIGVDGAQGTQGEQGPAGGSTGTNYNDNVKVQFGNSNDLQIFHDGSNSYIDDAGTGNLKLNSNEVHILSNDNSEYSGRFISNGAAELYYDGNKKFETKSDGVLVTGELQATTLDINGSSHLDGTVTVTGNLDLQDNDKLILGTGNDLQIYHDGTHSYINDSGTGNLKVLTSSMVVKNAADSETMLQVTQNGSVDLYYDNSKKLETTSSGVTITGSAQLTSDSGLYIRSSTNGTGAKIKFSSNSSGSYGQNGTIQYLHGDGDVTTTGGNSNDGWLVSGTETRTVFKVEGDIEATSNVYASSDISLKDNIVTYENALDKVLALRGVEYDRNDLDGVHEVGLIAQEVEEIIPELVGESRDGLKNIAYGKLTAVLIEAVKELKKENDALSARIKSLEDR